MENDSIANLVLHFERFLRVFTSMFQAIKLQSRGFTIVGVKFSVARLLFVAKLLDGSLRA